jgi:hypothetical protein
MITVIFEDLDLEELIFTGENRKYRIYSRDKQFMRHLVTVYNTLCSVDNTSELKIYSFLHYEKLKHKNQSSVRVMNKKVERIIFRETEDGVVITLLELNNDHYGNKK